MAALPADVELTIRPRIGFSLSHKWRTSLQTSIDGTEKRSALHTWPRVGIDYATKLINDTEFNWVKRKLYKYLYGTWGLPIWPDKTILTSQANSGQAILNVGETTNRHFYVGRDVIIINPTDFQTWEIAAIDSLTATTITLSANLSNTWPVGSLVLPRYLIRMESPQEVQAKVFQYQEFTFSAVEKYEDLRSFTYTLPSSGALFYRGLDIFQFVPYKGIVDKYKKPWNLLQFLGLGYSYSYHERTLLGIKAEYQEASRSSLWNMLKFFDSKMGRWGEFWIPTWQKDIVVTSAFSGTDTTLNIQNIEYSSYWAVGDDFVGEYIQFYFPDGTFVYRKIIGSLSNTSIVIDSGTGKAVTAGELNQLVVSFLMPICFDIDEIKLDYLTGKCEDVADVKLSFRGLERESVVFAYKYYMWVTGWNNTGQLGLGSLIDKNVFTQVDSSFVKQMSGAGEEAVGEHTLVIKEDGTLWATGRNTAGELGLGNNTNTNTFTQVGSGTTWLQVACGRYHTLAIKTDGTLWATGQNDVGQLGLGNNTNTNTFTQVGSGTTWSKLACGKGHTVAIKTDGTLWATGWNSSGQLGLGNIIDTNTFTQVGSGTTWSKVACGSEHTLAIKTDGTLWVVGNNGSGQLGLGNLINTNTFTQVGSSTWKQAAGAHRDTLAIKKDGTLWGAGFNYYGELGLGDNTQRTTLIQVGSGTTWSKVACGYYFTLAIKSAGTLWATGRNNKGQLGLGNIIDRNTFVRANLEITWDQIACGCQSTFALKEDLSKIYYLYIADAGNNRIVKRLASDLSFMSKIGSGGLGDDQFQNPYGIVFDETYIYIADLANNRIVKRLASDLSYVSKIGTNGAGDDQFSSPWAIASDEVHLYIADTGNHRIVKRLASNLSYVSKIGALGVGNDQFNNLSGIATDGTYLYIADTGNHRIVKRLASDLSYVSKIGAQGLLDDQFESPRGIATDGTYLYIADTGNHRIVKRLASNLSYVSKIGALGVGNDQFDLPRGIANDRTYLYIGDSNNNRIVKRLASDLSYVSKIGTNGAGDDQFYNPVGITV